MDQRVVGPIVHESMMDILMNVDIVVVVRLDSPDTKLRDRRVEKDLSKRSHIRQEKKVSPLVETVTWLTPTIPSLPRSQK